MPPETPFVDAETGSIDTDRVLYEAIPLAKLIALIAVIAIVPLALLAIGLPPRLATIFTLASQFILAVGSGLVLLYVISRGIQLSRE